MRCRCAHAHLVQVGLSKLPRHPALRGYATVLKCLNRGSCALQLPDGVSRSSKLLPPPSIALLHHGCRGHHGLPPGGHVAAAPPRDHVPQHVARANQRRDAVAGRNLGGSRGDLSAPLERGRSRVPNTSRKTTKVDLAGSDWKIVASKQPARSRRGCRLQTRTRPFDTGIKS